MNNARGLSKIYEILVGACVYLPINNCNLYEISVYFKISNAFALQSVFHRRTSSLNQF